MGKRSHHAPEPVLVVLRAADAADAASPEERRYGGGSRRDTDAGKIQGRLISAEILRKKSWNRCLTWGGVEERRSKLFRKIVCYCIEGRQRFSK